MDANVVVLNQGYDQAFQAREQQLIDQLSAYDDLVISFSGRLESCYCIDLCRASGVRIRAMIMDTPTRSRSEVSRAIRYCRRYGIDHWIVKTDEMIFCDQLSQLDEIIDPFAVFVNTGLPIQSGRHCHSCCRGRRRSGPGT